jgi:hypothetical protein
VTQIKIILSVFGDVFNPEKFSEYTTIAPTNFWIKGDEIPLRKGLIRRKGAKPVRKESAWEYSTGFREGLYFDEISKVILEKFAEHALQIRNYIQKERLNIKMDVVIEIVDNQIPSISVSTSLISFLNEIGSELDFDIYVLENE